MRRRTATCGAVLIWCLAGAAPASAGTYEVVSCGAPGAGGVNLAWTAETYRFNAPPEPESYNLVNECGGPNGSLKLETSRAFLDDGNGGNRRASFLSAGEWRFTAPPGTRIVKMTAWRHGARLRTGPVAPEPPEQGGRDAGDPWEQRGKNADNSTIGGSFGESCPRTPTPEEMGCAFGSDTGISDASRKTYDLNTPFVAYQIVCSAFRGCDRYFAANGEPPFSISTVKLFGSIVTIQDDGPPSLKVSGPLFADGLRTSADPLAIESGDASGIRAVRLDVDGTSVRRDTLTCDFRRTAPCPLGDTRSLSLAGLPLADGEHVIAAVAEDASGNESRSEKRIRVDANGPRIAIDRLSGKRISATVTDAGSGVVAGSVDVRDAGATAFRPLSSKLDGSRLSATLDKGSANRVGLRITARDNAGNQTVVEGEPTRLSATRAVVGRRTRTIRGGRVRSSAKSTVTIRGTLRGSNGARLAGRPIEVTAALRRSGAGLAPIGTVTTGADGTFAAQLPPGPSRQVRLAFNGEGGGLPSAQGVSLRVPASTTIRPSTRALRGRGRVSFTGKLSLAGQRVPRSGKIIELQGKVGRRYQTIATTRARGSSAKWRASYRFRTGQPGRYRFRARVRRESAFPFELGYSRVVTIRVR